MPTITVQIEDTLNERLTSAKRELVDAALQYVGDNLRTVTADMDDLNEKNWQTFNDLADSNTPIETSEIEGLWLLHRDKLEEAYENAVGGENHYENNGMMAIYHYIDLNLRMFADSTIADLLERFVSFRDSGEHTDEQLSAWLTAQSAEIEKSL